MTHFPQYVTLNMLAQVTVGSLKERLKINVWSFANKHIMQQTTGTDRHDSFDIDSTGNLKCKVWGVRVESDGALFHVSANGFVQLSA